MLSVGRGRLKLWGPSSDLALVRMNQVFIEGIRFHPKACGDTIQASELIPQQTPGRLEGRGRRRCHLILWTW